jgi:hypothetical protein
MPVIQSAAATAARSDSGRGEGQIAGAGLGRASLPHHTILPDTNPTAPTRTGRWAAIGKHPLQVVVISESLPAKDVCSTVVSMPSYDGQAL